MPLDAKLMELARRAARPKGLIRLWCARSWSKSPNWNPWAMRYEPLFFAKYVAPLYTNNKVGATEAYARGISWGLMQ